MNKEFLKQKFDVEKHIIGTESFEINQDLLKGFSEEDLLEKSQSGGYDFDFLNSLSDEFEKGKVLPVGTIKKRPNGEFIKTANGWKYHGKGEKKSSEDKDRSKKEVSKQGIYQGNWGTISSIDYIKNTAQFSRFGTRTPEIVDLSNVQITNQQKKDISLSQETKKKESSEKKYSFDEVLASSEGKKIIEGIEGLDPKRSDHKSLYEDYKKQLKEKFGFDYKDKDWDNQSSSQNKHVSDMSNSEKLDWAKKLGIQNPEKLSSSELKKQITDKNIENQIKDFKRSRSQ